MKVRYITVTGVEAYINSKEMTARCTETAICIPIDTIAHWSDNVITCQTFEHHVRESKEEIAQLLADSTKDD